MPGWQIAFTGEWAAWPILLATAAATAGAWAFYRHKRSKLSGRTLRMLVTLRLLAIGVLAAFMLQPVLRLTRPESAPKVIAVLLDTSRSMAIQDAVGARSRLSSAVSLLQDEPYQLLSNLDRRHRVRLYTFGAAVSELAERARLDALLPHHRVTSIGDALESAAEALGRDRLMGMVLLTDGISTSGLDPVEVAAGLGAPVFTVAVGGAARESGLFCDIGISRAPGELETVVNTRAPVRVEVAHRGLARFADEQRTIGVRLLEGDDTLDEKRLVLPADDGSTPLELEYMPRRTGLQMLQVELTALPGEVVKENNRRVFVAQVTDPRIRVLVVEGVPRTEYRFLRRVLESDPNIELTAAVKLAKGRFLVQGAQPGVDMSRGLPGRFEDYRSFDVVVLGDIGREEFSGVQIEHLKRFVDGGGGLLALGGYRAFGAGGFADSALADILPVRIGGIRDGHVEEAFAPVLTSNGELHPVLEGCAALFQGTPRRLTLDGANRVGPLKPGAQALLVHPDLSVEGRPMPVLAAQNYGQGRTIAIAADTTWKWQFEVEGLGADSTYYRFWRQAARWLAARGAGQAFDDEPVTAWSPRARYGAAEPAVLKARVQEPGGRPTGTARVSATVYGPQQQAPHEPEEAASVDLLAVPLAPGQYQAEWQPGSPGLHTVVVTARDAAGEIGSAEFQFVVGEPTSEFTRVDVAEEVLQRVTTRSGGAYHTLATAARIPQEIDRRRTLVVRRREVNLSNTPYLFALLLALLATEWVLRKRRDLN